MSHDSHHQLPVQPLTLYPLQHTKDVFCVARTHEHVVVLQFEIIISSPTLLLFKFSRKKNGKKKKFFNLNVFFHSSFTEEHSFFSTSASFNVAFTLSEISH